MGEKFCNATMRCCILWGYEHPLDSLLSETDINMPSIVPGSVDTDMHPSWQVHLSIVPIQNTIATGHELFSPVYVGSTVLVLILLAVLVVFVLLTYMWFACTSLVLRFSEPISSPTHFTTAPKGIIASFKLLLCVVCSSTAHN